MRYPTLRLEWKTVTLGEGYNIASFIEATMNPKMQEIFNKMLMPAIDEMRKCEGEMTEEERDDGVCRVSACLDSKYFA